MDWLAVGVGIGVVVLIGGAVMIGRRMPYPFDHDGARYKRMPDGSFLDANKQPVSDLALRANLQASYERAKYGTDETKDWGNASD